MSKKYKFAENDKLYFVSFAVTIRIDLFIRNEYKEEILKIIKYCQADEDLELHGWCSRWLSGDKPCTSHYWYKRQLFAEYNERLKRHTAEVLYKSIQNNNSESRREWMLWMMERSAKKNRNAAKFQLWQPESHPIQLIDNKMAHQKLGYIHYNPVEAGFVIKPEEWKYSSAIDYFEGNAFWKS